MLSFNCVYHLECRKVFHLYFYFLLCNSCFFMSSQVIGNSFAVSQLLSFSTPLTGHISTLVSTLLVIGSMDGHLLLLDHRHCTVTHQHSVTLVQVCFMGGIQPINTRSHLFRYALWVVFNPSTLGHTRSGMLHGWVVFNPSTLGHTCSGMLHVW